MYFINETKKQIIDSKKLHFDFEDSQQLLAYICICQGDTIRTEFQESEFIEDWLYAGKHNEYKYIALHKFNISPTDDLYYNEDVERLTDVVNKKD